MITNEQVEAALKAWYDAGDAGNFASMFAALKAADLASCARIAELELKVASMIQPYDFYDDRIAELEAENAKLKAKLWNAVGEICDKATRAAIEGEKE